MCSFRVNAILSLLSLQEGANINKSLTTLGKVISALAEVVGVTSVCLPLFDKAGVMSDKRVDFTVFVILGFWVK